MNDLISRQAAIEAIADTLKYENYGFLSDELESVINNVPTAEPERTQDAIDRQAAIDVADKFSDADGCNGSDVAMDIISGLISLPSAQTELEEKIRAIGYTGKEGRIYIGGRLFAVRELPQ